MAAPGLLFRTDTVLHPMKSSCEQGILMSPTSLIFSSSTKRIQLDGICKV